MAFCLAGSASATDDASGSLHRRIIAGGEIAYPPYSFLDETGEPSGFQVELTRAIARVMGLDIEIRLTPWPEARRALDIGTVDIIIGMFHSVDRVRHYDFSPPYSINSTRIFARKGSPPVKSIDDLRNKEIIVMRSAAMHEYVLTHDITDRLLLTDTPADALRLLASGKGDYALGAQMPGYYWIRELQLTNLVAVGPSLESFKNCFAVKKGTMLLLSRFTEGLTILKQTGEFQELHRKWFAVFEPQGYALRTVLHYAAAGIVPLVLLLTGACIWSWSLRKQVAAKTAALNREIVLHKNAEAAARESAKKLISAQECAHIGSWDWDIATDTVTWSDELYRITGLDPRQSAPSYAEHAGIYTPESLDVLKSAVERTLQNEEPYQLELECRRPDGSMRQVIAYGYPKHGSDGRISGMYGLVQDITERKKAEALLCEREERLALALEGADLGTWDWNIETNEVLFNRRWAEMLGYRLDEIEPHVRTWENMVHPEDLPAVRAALNAHLAAKTQSYEYEFRMRHKSGDWIWILDKGKVIEWDSSGTPERACGTHLDISDRKRAEHDLLESENRFRAVFETSPDAILIFNTDGVIVSANPAALEMYGYTKEEMIGLAGREIVHPDYYHLFEHFKMQLERTGKFFAESVDVRKDGTPFYIEVSGVLFSYMNKPHFLAMVRDVTERKTAEESLRESEERYRLLVESAVDAIFIIDPQRHIISWNRAAEKIFGYSAGEIIGKDFSILVPAWLREKHMENITLLFSKKQTGMDMPLVGSGLKKDGTEFFMENTFNIFDSKTGPCVFTIVRDSTERRNMEELLRQAQKLESIGTLAGGIAHDFNNILAAIIGNTEMLLDDLPREDDSYWDAVQILQAADRARNLVKQILAFSRKAPQNIKTFSMGILLRETITMLRSTIPSTIDIESHIDCPNDTVFGDESQIGQVVMNLCVNAEHAMHETGGRLYIALSNIVLSKKDAASLKDLLPGEYIRLIVRDTGQGISEDVIDKIYDPFFTTKEVGKGTGLGLSVVHGIVQNHRGSVSVQSVEGEGATFRVLLPVGAEEESEKDVVEKKPLTGENEHILLIDDEAMLLKMCKRMLERLGYRVTTFANSSEALSAFRDNPEKYDAVLCDMTMPRMTGKTLAREMLSIRPDTPIVLCTGYSDLITEAECRKIGIKGFVMKPHEKRILAKTIRAVLEKP